MVIVNDFAVRENSKGETFIALILTGGLEMIRSKNTGKFYASIRKASIPCTFTEEVAEAMKGSKMPGTIVKVPCAPYTYLSKDGEEVEIDFTYEYQQEPLEVAETVMA
jgi:hypothetical protein